MKDDTLHKEERNRKLGFYISSAIHGLLFLLFFIPFLKMIKFPPEESGIMVMFGEPNSGQNSDVFEPIKEVEPNTSASSVAKPDNNDVYAQTRDDVSDVKATEVKKSIPKANKEVDNKKKKEAERLENEKQEKLAKEREAAEKKKQLSDLFGKGKGNNNKSGNDGSPNGEPNGKVLDGITKGSGRVGGGLSSRGLVFEPIFQDNSQRSGRVVLTLCVDAKGKVISSKFTQKGSTTSDPYLIQITEKTASKYTFTPSEIDSQCGTITVDYKVQ
ncbi:MAG: hypothetical protein WAT79_04015 [Saprospiraceae bacterium]